jgi:uncharacterized membrane protein YfcA
MNAAAIFPLLALTVFLTAVISGTFGMAGGMILMFVLLLLMPVPAAMAIHACIQLVSNGWRCFLWRRHIVWRTLPFYALGVAVGFGLVVMTAYVPDKPWALIVMGTLPLLSLAVRRFFSLSITNRAHAFGAAIMLTFIQMTAGVVGPLLDVLYNNAPLTRKEIVSTKAFTQSSMHLLRLVYYGAFVSLARDGIQWPDGIGPAHMAVFVAASLAGTTLAARILHRLSDEGFKQASRYIIGLIGSVCLGQGVYLLLFAGT